VVMFTGLPTQGEHVAVGTAKDLSLEIDISPDRQEAYVLLRADQDHDHLVETEVYQQLKKRRIVLNDFVRERTKELLRLLEKGSVPAEPFLIAKGQPPTEPIDAEFVWDDAFKHETPPADDEGTVNFYERHKLVTVDPDTVIGYITAAQPGKEGIDVYGNPVKPRRRAVNIKLGGNVALDSDGKTVRSTSSGQVIIEGSKLSIRTVLDVPGNVDFETGNVDAASDVLIRGLVRDLFIVKSGRNISIRGMVEGAYLFADGDVTIVGGVKGRGKGLIEAGGNVHAKFLNHVYLVAGGDLEIGKELIDGTVVCGGQLRIKHGSIIGGQQYAMGDIHVKSLGSPVGVKTVVGAGCDPRLSRRILDLDRKITKTKEVIEKIQRNVEPLLQHLKRLMPEQREKATELMYRVSTLEEDIKRMEDEKQEIRSRFPEPTAVEIQVSSKIFPNTVVHIANKFAAVQSEIKGPVKIVLRKVAGVTQMLLIDRISGSIRTMRAQPVSLDVLELPDKPEIVQPGTKTASEQDNKS